MYISDTEDQQRSSLLFSTIVWHYFVKSFSKTCHWNKVTWEKKEDRLLLIVFLLSSTKYSAGRYLENFERTSRKKFPKQDGFQSTFQSWLALKKDYSWNAVFSTCLRTKPFPSQGNVGKTSIKFMTFPNQWEHWKKLLISLEFKTQEFCEKVNVVFFSFPQIFYNLQHQFAVC